MSEGERERVENPQVAYEERDVNARALAYIGGAILVAAVVIHLAVGALEGYLSAQETRRGKPPRTLVGVAREPPPEPRLQPDPAGDLRELRRAEQARLGSYGWLDREQGVVRIPVERAMELLAQRGWPSPATTAVKATAHAETNAATHDTATHDATQQGVRSAGTGGQEERARRPE